jgi:hypothetical protein
MSTKTLRKRIALVAVSALGAGLLSVVPVTSANAALTDADNVTANVTDAVSVASASNVAGSVGLLSESGEGTTQTAVLLATGAINVFLANDSDATTTASATVTGGRFTKAASGNTISGTSGTSAGAGSASGAMGLVAVPNSGATSMVIEFYQDTTTTSTLSKRITVTIVATSAYNSFASTYSYAYWGDGSPDTSADDANSANSSKTNGLALVGSVGLADSYGNAISTSNTGILTATVTTGARVNLGSTTVAGSTTLDYQSVTGGVIDFNVQQATANAPWSGTVTFAFDGVVFATKSGVITGEVASISVTSPKIGKKNTPNTGAATIAYADAAGNAVYLTAGEVSTTTPVTATVSGTIVTNLSVGTAPSSSSTPGKVTMTCSNASAMGAVKGLQMQHLNASGTIVKSNIWDSGCADVPYTVVASWDRVSYVPGSIATLTLLFKDSKGNLANAYDAIGADSNGALLTVTGGPSAAAITPIAATNTPSGVTGAATYQFVVGTTEGDYVAVIVPTEVKENTAAVGVTTANISLPYSVKSTSTAVTNADVLKAIVSLIASINKQIAALQKAILKK